MTINMTRRCVARHRGFTLIEATMAVVVLAIAAAGVLLPFTSGAALRAEGRRMTLAAKLAADLMEEIVASPYEDIVTGYDGYSEPQGQVKDTAGVVFADSTYANFSREAGCQYVYVPQESGTTEPVFIRATVRVYYQGKQTAIVNRLISQ
jgi:prepilin-type N-terminal cleavage/methylation domain-containing protein